MKFLGPPSSGSARGDTFSRNRFGQYCRTRATPVNPNSVQQSAIRDRLATNAAAWRALDSTQQAGWASLGAMMVRTDALGQTYTLNGFLAYCSVNQNRLTAGDAVLDNAPALATPSNILTATITLTGAAFSVAYTATPLAAATRLFIFASPQRSAGRAFENDYRLITVTAAAAASPANILAAYQARLGTPVADNRIFLKLQTYFGGFLSGGLLKSQVVS